MYYCLVLIFIVIFIFIDLVNCLVDLEYLSFFGFGLVIYLKRCVIYCFSLVFFYSLDNLCNILEFM